MAEVGLTYSVEKKCPICGQMTKVTKVRSRLISLGTDCDMCTHYQDINPYHYTIWVCDNCGYAGDENHFLKGVPARGKKKIVEFLNGRKIGFKYVQDRTMPDAVASYKLAIYYAELTDDSLAHIAGLYLKLAWCYRIAGDTYHEEPMLRKAAETYERSLISEEYPVGPLTDSACEYLVGAIYSRLNDPETASKYISRLVSNRDLQATDRKLFEKARDLWEDLKEARELAKNNKAKELAADAAAKKA